MYRRIGGQGSYLAKGVECLRIGLIDVDSHNYPNLALMKLSAWHKQNGDSVSWWNGFDFYDLLYISKVFSASYSPEPYIPVNADQIVLGGSGWAIHTSGGMEIYDRELDPPLPPQVEHIMPDYGLYPELTKDKAFGRLTEGCPKKCPWCHVCAMQGQETKQTAEIFEFWNGQREIDIMDANILACPDREKLLLQIADTKVRVSFSQGLDIQRAQDCVDLLNRINHKKMYFAWDDPKIDLTDNFATVGSRIKIQDRRRRNVYVLTHFGGSKIKDALERIYILRSLNFDPYVMIYDKPSAPKEYKDLQRWCNNKIIFYAEPDFENYNRRRRG